jgi:L-ribulose-5-phosphate 4-epimerase
MLEDLKQQVCQANLDLVDEGLVIQTWGNVSGVDREKGLMVIKPSGVPYETMTADDMAVVSLDSGERVEGKLKPSSDTPTHLVLYRAFEAIGGVVHTHSLYATAWAQAMRDVPPLGTTHADYVHGPIPCTRMLRVDEIEGDYEANTGHVIVERLAGIDPRHCPAVLVAGHGPFAWGHAPGKAVTNAAVLEHLCRLASETLRIDAAVDHLPHQLLDKHFLRKHGPDAYYGQG